jgi:hypothetical protein
VGSRGHHGRDPVLGGRAFVNKAHPPVALHREEGMKEIECRASKRGIVFAYASKLFHRFELRLRFWDYSSSAPGEHVD